MKNKMNNKSWTARQKDICEGLRCIGEEIVSFFESALNHYFNEKLPNRAYQIAHAAREIDGGLRDIFAPKSSKQLEESFIKKDLKSIFGLEVKTYKGHIASILTALNVDHQDELAGEWAKVATQFAKYAHRRGSSKESRKFEEFKPYWDRYEAVLLRLVGSFYAIINRIDRLIKLEVVNEDSCGALLNIIRSKPYENYFFREVRGLQWFYPLNNEAIFNPKKIKIDKNGNTSFWPVLDYLERVSEQVRKKFKENKLYGVELLKIINEIVKFSEARKKQIGESLNDYRIWWYCVKILNNIPNDIILEHLASGTGGDDRNDKYNFRTWLEEWTNSSFGDSLTISDIGGKLLGKFLKDENMIPYAETIIDVITGIRKDGTKNEFNKREDASLAWDSFWIRDSFKKHAELIGQKCSIECVICLADKLKKTLEYKQKDSCENLEIENNVYQLKVCRVQKEGLKDGEIGFKKSDYDCIVTQYTIEQAASVDIKKDSWGLHTIDPKGKSKSFSFAANTKKIFISEIKKNPFSGIDWQKVKNSEKEIGNLFDNLYEDYSQIWIRSLESGSSFHSNEAKEVLTTILRDILVARCKAKGSDVRSILESFLSDEYRFPIFKKFVLLCLDKYWANYPDLFEKFMESKPNLLEKSDWEVELQDLLLNRNKKFSPKLKDKLKELIRNVPEYYKKEGAKFVAYWKYKWFSPLKDNHEFSAMYNEAKEQAEIKDDKPYKSDRSTFKSGSGSHKSSLSKEEILSKPIAELIKFLKEFKGADFWHGTFEGEPDKEGLCDALQSAVKENPNKFTEELGLFNQQGLYRYVSSILLGFREALSEEKLLQWSKIFDFSQKYIKQPWFLSEASDEQRGDSGGGKYIWVVDTIVDLIKAGSKDNKQAFDPKYFEVVESIFDSLLSRVKGEERPDTERDAVTYALNTTLGKVIESYIIFSLRVSRVRQKNKEEIEKNWDKEKYERFLTKGIEAYIWFGRYLPNIRRYLDQKYTDKKIKVFSELAKDDYNWQMFMEGYLTGYYVYDDLYSLMRPHYIRAIESKVFEKRVDKNLVQHITIGYLRKHELLEGKDSLFWKILDEANTPDKRKRWLEVASFFWSISGRSIKKKTKNDDDKPSKETKERILKFWKWTFDKKNYVETKLGTDYSYFLNRMSELTLLLPKIDEETEKWLMLSASHIDKNVRSMFFIKCLTKFEDDESVKRIGKIFLKVLENNIPRFEQENIQLIVKRLYKLSEKDPKKYSDVKKNADEICSIYGRSDMYFLRDTFCEHQKTT